MVDSEFPHSKKTSTTNQQTKNSINKKLSKLSDPYKYCTSTRHEEIRSNTKANSHELYPGHMSISGSRPFMRGQMHCWNWFWVIKLAFLKNRSIALVQFSIIAKRQRAKKWSHYWYRYIFVERNYRKGKCLVNHPIYIHKLFKKKNQRLRIQMREWWMYCLTNARESTVLSSEPWI